jgi:hypothetical protein
MATAKNTHAILRNPVDFKDSALARNPTENPTPVPQTINIESVSLNLAFLNSGKISNDSEFPIFFPCAN